MRAATGAGTVADALAAATDALAAAGCDSPRLDAELLLAETTAEDRAALAAHPERVIDPSAARSFGEMVRRRIRREPVAYILRRKGFRGLELAVDRRVLVPRPETELLVEIALELEPASVLDVGTGSGAVALAVADELPHAKVTATDTSADALTLAGANAAHLGLAERVRFAPGTLPRTGTFDLLVANLPYVSEAEWAGLAPEVVAHEPREALVPGPTGLEAISALLAQLAVRPLASTVALEVGIGQADEVARLAVEAGYRQAGARRDLAGIERVVVARR